MCVMGLRPPLLLPTLLPQLQLLGACCIYIHQHHQQYGKYKKQNKKAVGMGEGPDFGSEALPPA
jgi:hypothetical protein